MLYTKKNKKDIILIRKRFEKTYKRHFLMYAYRYEPALRLHFTWEQAVKGWIPQHLAVHHILPLAGGGSNEFTNLAIMSAELHKHLHDFILHPQIQYLTEGDSVKLWFPAAIQEAIDHKELFWHINPGLLGVIAPDPD